MLGDMPWEVGEPKWGNCQTFEALRHPLLTLPFRQLEPCMSIKIEDYYPRETFQKMKAFADERETPFVVIDTKIISDSYDQLVSNFPFAKIYYAVKANPATEIT